MKNLLYLLLTIGVLTSCGDSEQVDNQNQELDTVKAQIERYEAKIYAGDASRFDQAAALMLADAYIRFQGMAPEDPAAPDYLFKAAELVTQLGDYQRAIRLFDQVYEEYPQYKNQPLALFYKGSIYDDRLQMDEKAREQYELFIKNHPDHEFADDAKMLITLLGKSDEEILREFEERNKLGAEAEAR